MKFVQMEAGNYINAETIGEIKVEKETKYNQLKYETTVLYYKVTVVQAFTGCPRFIYRKAKTQKEAEHIASELVKELSER